MIIIVKQEHTEKELEHLINWVKDQGLAVDVSKGANSTVLGLIGDTSVIDIEFTLKLWSPGLMFDIGLQPIQIAIDVYIKNLQVVCADCTYIFDDIL